MLTILLTVISLKVVSGLEIDLDFPDEVELDEEFEVTISTDSDDEEYDVKIFVHDSDDSEIDRDEYVSEIYDSEEDDWEDSWYYLNEAYPYEDEFEVRVFDGEGRLEICVRLRKSSDHDSGFEEECDRIEVLEAEEEDEYREDSEEPAIWRNEPPEEKQEIQPIALQKQDKITLNSPKQPIEEPELTTIKTPEGNKRTMLMFSFTGFCVLIIVLLAMKKL